MESEMNGKTKNKNLTKLATKRFYLARIRILIVFVFLRFLVGRAEASGRVVTRATTFKQLLQRRCPPTRVPSAFCNELLF